MHHKPVEFIGLDVGSAKFGVARGSDLAKIAQPMKAVSASNIIDELITLISKGEIDGIVVGLPRNLQGDETKQTQDVRDWVNQAKQRIKRPFYFQDEALTSQKAGHIKNGGDEHSLAASIILQDFLDSSEDDRVEA